MARNTMKDLQNHLFEVIEGLKNNNDPDADPKEKMDIGTAKAISMAAQVLIESAKAEFEVVKFLGGAENPTLAVRQAKNLMLGSGMIEEVKE